MSIFLLLLILGGLVVVVVRLLSLGERLAALERPGGTAAETLAADTVFGDLRGEALWSVLSGVKQTDPDTLASLREHYRPVLERHLEEIFLEGVLDARQGIRATPAGDRVIRGSNGTVSAWLPPELAATIYSTAQDSTRLPVAAPAESLTSSLADACRQAHERIGLSGGAPLAARLLPRSATSGTGVASPAGAAQAESTGNEN
jgi:hypothetical protein